MQVKLLPMSVLRTLEPDELDSMARECSKAEKIAKDAQAEHKSNNPAAGKIWCALEERLNKAKNDRTVAMNTSMSTYWENITKTKPNGHMIQCATAFGWLVRTEQLSEENYDKCSANFLQIAGQIANAVSGDVTHQIVPKVVNELKERTKDSKKILLTLLDSVKTKEPMDAEKAGEMLKRIFADGHLNLVLAAAGAEICYLTGEKAKNAYFNLMAAGQMVDKHFGETADAWLAEQTRAQEKANAPLKVITEETPAETPAETPLEAAAA